MTRRNSPQAPSVADRAPWNESMNQILSASAEVRDQLERARSAEDARLANQQTAASLALIDAQGWSNEGAAPQRPASDRDVRPSR
jgi:hypothetical protein